MKQNNNYFQSKSITLWDQMESTFGDLTVITAVPTKEKTSDSVRIRREKEEEGSNRNVRIIYK